MTSQGKRVLGIGPKPADVMLVGEAPGLHESNTGIPFVGKAGDELNGQYLPLAGLRRYQVRIDNVYCYRPGANNQTPSDAQIYSDDGITRLLCEVGAVKPRVIVAMGVVACSVFGMSVPLEWGHGKPFEWNGIWIFPAYHPAAGLHNTRMMTQIREDFERLGRFVNGGDMVGLDGGRFSGDDDSVGGPPTNQDANRVLAVDTETVNGLPWSIQFCGRHQGPQFISADDVVAVDKTRDQIEHNGGIVALHNAKFDLGVLDRLGIRPAHVRDTMQMAYLLGGEPKSLKALAYRHLGVRMRTYAEVVAPASRAKAVVYLTDAALHTWPDPQPVTEFRGKRLATRKPQNITRKIRRLLADLADPKKDVDPVQRWHQMEGTECVSDVLGPMPEGTLADVPRAEAIAYACADADMTLQLHNVLWPRVEAERLVEAHDRDVAIAPMLVEMERNGMRIDRAHFTEFAADLTARLDSVWRTLCAHMRSECYLRGEDLYNPNSPAQCADYCRYKRIRVKSTEQKFLEPFAEKHEGIRLHLEYKKLSKLLGTYVEKMPRLADADDRVHYRLHLTVADTGRLTSSDPNFQNIPTRSEDGKRIRRGFITDDGNSFLALDYNQIEMRIAAHMSEDPLMLDIYRKGKDIHAETSRRIFGDATDAHRYAAKRVGFGVLYGISGKGLWQLFESEGVNGWSETQCDMLIREWFDVYRGVAELMQSFRDEAIMHGRVHDIFGRYRLVPEVHSALNYVVEAGLRQAGNAPIQSGAQGVIKEAMRRVWPLCCNADTGYRSPCRPLLQIHDELLFEVSDDQLRNAAVALKQCMESAVTLRVPITVDCEVGKNWAELEKLEV